MVDRLTDERLFVAIGLPEEVRQAIRDWRTDFDLPGRLVPTANMHITLRFIGDVDEVGRDRVMAALDELETVDAFSIRIGGLGAFPKISKATVAWAAIEDDGDLVDLAEAVDTAVYDAGLGHEDRPFHPHLTLSRIRPQRDLSDIRADNRLGAKISVDHFTLSKSLFVGRGGVRYEEIARFVL